MEGKLSLNTLTETCVFDGSAFSAVLSCKQFVVLTVKTGDGGKCIRNGLGGVTDFSAYLMLRTNT